MAYTVLVSIVVVLSMVELSVFSLSSDSTASLWKSSIGLTKWRKLVQKRRNKRSEMSLQPNLMTSSDSELWLLSKDDPVPSYMNQKWFPKSISAVNLIDTSFDVSNQEQLSVPSAVLVTPNDKNDRYPSEHETVRQPPMKSSNNPLYSLSEMLKDDKNSLRLTMPTLGAPSQYSIQNDEQTKNKFEGQNIFSDGVKFLNGNISFRESGNIIELDKKESMPQLFLPDSFLLEIPMETSVGTWEQPKPDLMNKLVSSSMSINTKNNLASMLMGLTSQINDVSKEQKWKKSSEERSTNFSTSNNLLKSQGALSEQNKLDTFFQTNEEQLNSVPFNNLYPSKTTANGVVLLPTNIITLATNPTLAATDDVWVVKKEELPEFLKSMDVYPFSDTSYKLNNFSISTKEKNSKVENNENVIDTFSNQDFAKHFYSEVTDSKDGYGSYDNDSTTVLHDSGYTIDSLQSDAFVLDKDEDGNYFIRENNIPSLISGTEFVSNNRPEALKMENSDLPKSVKDEFFYLSAPDYNTKSQYLKLFPVDEGYGENHANYQEAYKVLHESSLEILPVSNISYELVTKNKEANTEFEQLSSEGDRNYRVNHVPEYILQKTLIPKVHLRSSMPYDIMSEYISLNNLSDILNTAKLNTSGVQNYTGIVYVKEDTNKGDILNTAEYLEIPSTTSSVEGIYTQSNVEREYIVPKAFTREMNASKPVPMVMVERVHSNSNRTESKDILKPELENMPVPKILTENIRLPADIKDGNVISNSEMNEIQISKALPMPIARNYAYTVYKNNWFNPEKVMLPIPQSSRTEKDTESPKPYKFGFDQNDGLGTLQHRQEVADKFGAVKGSYGYKDAIGVYRKVNYVADNTGFHAVVQTNEPGTTNRDSADVVVMAEAPPAAAIMQMNKKDESSENTLKVHL